MNLTWQQHDALAELINIAFSRTAASLSELTGYRVVLEKPAISIHAIGAVVPSLAETIQGEIATVHQVFGGEVAGDALLLLNYEGAVALTGLLMEGQPRYRRLDASSREVLTEVGNILLNACLGMFGNLLQVHVSFSVPRLHLESLDALLQSLIVGKDELRYALAVSTNFHIQERAVSGYLLIALGMVSLDRMLRGLEELG